MASIYGGLVMFQARMLATMMAIAGLTQQYCQAQSKSQEPDEPVSYTLELNEDIVKQIRQNTKIRSVVPDDLTQKIDRILVRSANTDSRNLSVSKFQSVEKRWNDGNLSLIMDWADYQRILESGQGIAVDVDVPMVKSVTLVLNPNTLATDKTSISKDGRFTAYVTAGQAISGKMVEPANLKLKATYGDLQIEWDQVQEVSILESSTGDQEENVKPAIQMIVKLVTGDQVTGSTMDNKLEMDTVWGHATVNLTDCQRISGR